MRQYALNLEKQGISYDRYRELIHFCRQYAELEKENRELIRTAAAETAGEYAEILISAICGGELPYRYLALPYSEAQYKRIRRSFFKRLHELKK
ncbi:MAG: hypothetical protein IKK29_02875 [Christensenellaceae bacterium]|nr:hypothetical protein [Christensenellaceae bacterium]